MKKPASRADQAIGGSIWMLAGAGVREGLLLALNIVLARILVPEDFAAVAIVMAVVSVINILSELGVSVALVQREKLDEETMDSAFVLTAVLFAACAAGLFACSGWIAAFYKLAALKPLMQIAALTFFLQGFSSFFRSLLLRDMRYKTITLGETLSTVAYGALALSGGLLGWKAHSIIVGYLGSAIVRVLAFWGTRRFRPKSLGSMRSMKSILGFGVWVSLGRVLGQASGRFDRLLLGKIVPAHDLGGYYMAHRLTTTIPSMVTGILDQVLLPIYSSSNNDPVVVERGYWKGLRYSALLVMPLCLLIAPFARQIVWVTMGAKWLFIVPVAQILSISGAIQALGGGIFASAVYASGMPRLNTLVNAFRVILLPACVLAGSRWGIEGVAWGVALFGLLGRLFNQWLLKRFLKYSFRRFFATIGLPLAANAITVAAGYAVSRLITLSAILPVLGLTLLAGAGCLSLYFLVCRLAMPEDTRFLLDQLKRVAMARLSKRQE